MGLKQDLVDLKDLCATPNVRLWFPFKLPKIKYPYDKLTRHLSELESGSRPKGGISNGYEGEVISLGGEQINSDGSVDLSKIPYVPHEFYDNTTKGKVKDEDILVCKDGALTGKTCIVDFDLFPEKKVMVNEHIYIFRGNEDINQKFLFYLTKNNLFQLQVKDLAYRKKGQPGLNLDHLNRIKIPFIPKHTQDKVVGKIEPLEERIRDLKNQIKQPQVIINNVFAKEFKFKIEEVYSIEQETFSFVSDTLASRNPNIRSSVRWHKIPPIQNIMYENINCIKKLGKYIKSTRNGWSPSCSVGDSQYYVFGVNSISKSGTINFEDLKNTDQTRNNIGQYFAKEGDLFVSRGNTVDLVALASVVENIDNMSKYLIFPDLFIKVEVDEGEVNKRYLAYLFNSIIGRLYFKYSSKGKNQTMVKISQQELYNFYLPIPSPKKQIIITEKIKKEIDEQEKLKNKIQAKMDEIDELIEKAIKNS